MRKEDKSDAAFFLHTIQISPKEGYVDTKRMREWGAGREIREVKASRWLS